MTDPVSIVIPTYNRPDSLRVAIGSVLAQTWEEWELLVVGDACDEATGDAVREFADDRIRYVNLPLRFGEQSGPNSVGIALSSGGHIAFLNHDDVWLADHLERAVGELRGGCDFFVGRSAFARRSVPDDEFGVAPLFTEVNPAGRTGRDAFVGGGVLFEPASAWVVSAALARRIGPWRSAPTMHRTPAQEWVMRAWRRGARFMFAEEITVLKVVTHYQYESASGNYSLASREHQWLQKHIEGTDVDAVRSMVLQQIDQSDHRPGPATSTVARLKQAAAATTLQASAGLYRRTGLDAYEVLRSFRRKQKGDVLDDASRLRTGAPVPRPPDLDAVLAQVGRG